MGSDKIEEGDLELLHALQIAPRVSWAEAARILGTSRATLAARWQRLRADGLAWVTAHPGGSYRNVTLALVEADCLPGARAQVVEGICRDPRVVTVEESTRGRDLLLTVITADLAGLTALLLDDLETLPGVARQRSYLATTVHRHGSHWRLDALSPAQQAAFERIARAASAASPASPSRNAWPLIDALSRDGRATAAELARATGRNTATVRRQFERLVRSDLISFRCELAAEISGWPVSSTWTARVEPADHDRTIAALATLPELRMCVSTTGDTNIAMTMWTHSLHDMRRVEGLLGQRMPWLQLRDSAVNLRTPKRMGWLLDAAGRSTGTVIPATALRGW